MTLFMQQLNHASPSANHTLVNSGLAASTLEYVTTGPDVMGNVPTNTDMFVLESMVSGVATPMRACVSACMHLSALVFAEAGTGMRTSRKSAKPVAGKRAGACQLRGWD